MPVAQTTRPHKEEGAADGAEVFPFARNSSLVMNVSRRRQGIDILFPRDIAVPLSFDPLCANRLRLPASGRTVRRGLGVTTVNNLSEATWTLLT